MKPLDTACGVCGAPVQFPCVSVTGELRPKPHAVRKAAAKRGNRPPHTAPRSAMPSWLEGKV